MTFCFTITCMGDLINSREVVVYQSFETHEKILCLYKSRCFLPSHWLWPEMSIPTYICHFSSMQLLRHLGCPLFLTPMLPKGFLFEAAALNTYIHTYFIYVPQLWTYVQKIIYLFVLCSYLAQVFSMVAGLDSKHLLYCCNLGHTCSMQDRGRSPISLYH